MEKPCGEECANEDSVFHNGVAQPKRFGVLEHPLQGFDDIRRIKFLKAVVDVALAAILRALHIVLHPLLQCLDAVGVPSAGDACDAVPVHAPHNVRDHRLHNSVVNILVRPQKRLVDVSPFALAAVRAYHQLWDTDSDMVTRSCESTIYSGSSNRFIFTTTGETGTESSRSRGLRG